MKTTAALLTLLLVTSAHANTVATITCEFKSALGNQHTDIELINDGTHQIASIKQTGRNFVNEFVGYEIKGTQVHLAYPFDRTYDISQAQTITTSKDCVRAAYGGDVTCVQATETCDVKQ
jgi:hypothetical protein